MVMLVVMCLLASLAFPASAGIIRLPMRRMVREASANEAMQSLLALSGASSSGTQKFALSNQLNLAYFAEVQVGTPGQSMLVLLDTGSANLWVPEKKGNLRQNGHHRTYNLRKSSTHIPTHERFHIEYGSGDVSGFYCRDTVALGGLVLSNFTFAHVHDTSGIKTFDSSGFDGILGLGFRANSVDNVSTAMEELVRSGQLGEPVFSFFLKDRQPGEFVIGGSDPAHYVGDFHYAEVSRTIPMPGQWAVDIAGVRVGEVLTITAARYALVDSGTSFVKGPPREIQAIAAMLGAHLEDDVLYVVPCDADLPSIAFTIGGKDLVLEPEDLIVDRQGNSCLLGLERSTIPCWVLGDVFMRKFYVQFDWGRKRVGFALANKTHSV